MHRFGRSPYLESIVVLTMQVVLFSDNSVSFMLVGLGATVNVAKPKPGSSVAIFGLGAVGLAVCYPLLFGIAAFIATDQGKY